MTAARATIAGVAVFCVAGALCSWVLASLHASFSVAVLALVLVLGVLLIARRIPASLEAGAGWLLRWLPLFFVPACVRVVDYAGALHAQLIAIAAALVLSTVGGIGIGVACGVMLQRVRRA